MFESSSALLPEVLGRDGAAVSRLMDGLARTGRFTIPETALAAIRADFAAGRADEADTLAAIRSTYEATGFLADPHTAVGLAVAPRFRAGTTPMVALATADPAKFGAAIDSALGFEPPLPPRLAGLILDVRGVYRPRYRRRRDRGLHRFPCPRSERKSLTDAMTVRTTLLPSGIGVATHAMDHLQSAALGVWVGVGSRDEVDGEHGIVAPP